MTYIELLSRHFKSKVGNDLAKVYVEAQGGLALNDKSFPISKTVLKRMEVDSKVPLRSVLILGESGLGKTECAKQIAKHLWDQYDRSSEKLLPIYFNLSAFAHLSQQQMRENLLPMVLESQGLYENDHFHEISDLQRDCVEGRVRMLLLIDGLDEGRVFDENIYYSNGWYEEWGKLRVLAFGRPSFLNGLDSDPEDLFSIDPNEFAHLGPSTFHEIWMHPFVDEDVDRFLKDYVDKLSPEVLATGWDAAEKYREAMDGIPTLASMITNPFILTHVVKCLPNLMVSLADDPGYLSTREKVYDAFMREDFKLKANTRIWSKQKSRETLIGSGVSDVEKLQACMHTYAERVSKFMWHCGEGKLQLFLSDADTLREELFVDLADRPLDEAARHILRDHSVLKNEDGVWRPRVHKSIIEFFVSKALFKSMHVLIDQERLDPEVSLNSHSIRSEPAIISMLVDMVHSEPEFHQQLLEMVKASAVTVEVRVASANALTVLVAAKKNVNGEDFTGISAVDADLTGMIADGTKFIGADLTNCDMTSAWVAHADFTDAILDDVELGSGLEIVHEKKRVFSAIAVDNDKETLYAGDVRGKVSVWNMATAENKPVRWVNANDDYQQYRRDESYPPIFLMHLSQDKEVLAYGTKTRVWLRHIDSSDLRYVDMAPGVAKFCGMYDFGLVPGRPSLVLMSEHDGGGTRLYNVDTNKVIKRVSAWPHFDISPDGKHVVCCKRHDDPEVRGGTVQVIPVTELLHKGKIQSMTKLAIEAFDTFGPDQFASQFSPSGRCLLVCTSTLMLFDTTSWELIKTFGSVKSSLGRVYVNFFPDESCVLVSVDNEQTVWHIESGSRYYVFKSHVIKPALYGRLISPDPCISTQNGVWFPGSYSLSEWLVASRYHFQKKIIPVLDQAQINPFHSFWGHSGPESANKKYKTIRDGVCMTFWVPSNRFKDEDEEKLFFGDGLIANKGKKISLELCVERADGSKVFQCEVPWKDVGLHQHEMFKDFKVVISRMQFFSALNNSKTLAAAGVVLFNHFFELYSFLRLKDKINVIRGLGHDNVINIYDMQHSGLIRSIKTGHIYKEMFFSADDKWLITYGDGVRIWDWRKGKRIEKYEMLDSYVTAATLSRDKQWLIMCTTGLSIYGYNKFSGKSFSFAGLVRAVTAVQFRHDDRTLIVWFDMDSFFSYEIVESVDHGAYLRLVAGTHEVGFNGEDANLDNAFLNSAKTVGLFRKHGFIGEPNYYDAMSVEEEAEFLEHCSHTSESVVALKYSLLYDTLYISYDSWVVSLVRHNKSEHAFVVLEGMDVLGRSVAIRFDFATSIRKEKVKPGFAKVCIRSTTIERQVDYDSELYRMLRSSVGRVKDDLRGRSWMITRQQGLALYKSISSERESGLEPYSMFGSARSARRAHNCYTFARNQLYKVLRDEIDINLPEVAADFFVARTSAHLTGLLGL